MLFYNKTIYTFCQSNWRGGFAIFGNFYCIRRLKCDIIISCNKLFFLKGEKFYGKGN